MGAVHTQDQWPGLSVAIFWPMRIYGPMRTYRQYWIFVQITRQPPDRRLTLYWTCDYLPMLGFKVNPCSPKRTQFISKALSWLQRNALLSFASRYWLWITLLIRLYYSKGGIVALQKLLCEALRHYSTDILRDLTSLSTAYMNRNSLL